MKISKKDLELLEKHPYVKSATRTKEKLVVVTEPIKVEFRQGRGSIYPLGSVTIELDSVVFEREIATDIHRNGTHTFYPGARIYAGLKIQTEPGKYHPHMNRSASCERHQGLQAHCMGVEVTEALYKSMVKNDAFQFISDLIVGLRQAKYEPFSHAEERCRSDRRVSQL